MRRGVRLGWCRARSLAGRRTAFLFFRCRCLRWRLRHSRHGSRWLRTGLAFWRCCRGWFCRGLLLRTGLRSFLRVGFIRLRLILLCTGFPRWLIRRRLVLSRLRRVLLRLNSYLNWVPFRTSGHLRRAAQRHQRQDGRQIRLFLPVVHYLRFGQPCVNCSRWRSFLQVTVEGYSRADTSFNAPSRVSASGIRKRKVVPWPAWDSKSTDP